MLKYTNSFIEVSALGDFETEIQKLYNRLKRESTIESDTLIPLSPDVRTPQNDYLYSDVLSDSGHGKISKGLKSLEMLSIIRTGTHPSSLFLFDNKVIYGTSNTFNTTSKVELIDTVLKNIGMYDIIRAMPDDEFTQYKDVCFKIALKVKSGTYTSDLYAAYIKSESKKIIKRYLNIWQA